MIRETATAMMDNKRACLIPGQRPSFVVIRAGMRADLERIRGQAVSAEEVERLWEVCEMTAPKVK